jgi:1-deoxy-D-xylulose-5-phosphate synthase
MKAAAERAGHALRLTFLRRLYHNVESRIKSLFLGNRYFEQFGLRYIGPVDGHNLDALKAAFTVAKEDKRSVIVHVVTKKGNGFKPA